jgi:ribosomal protein S7
MSIDKKISDSFKVKKDFNYNKFYKKKAYKKKFNYNSNNAVREIEKKTKKKTIKLFSKMAIRIRRKKPGLLLKGIVNFNYFNSTIYNIFFNSFTLNGMKKKSYKLAWQILQKIRKKRKFMKRVHNHVNFNNVFSNLITPIRIRKKKVGARVALVPSVSPYKRSVGTAVRWIKKNAFNLKKRYKFNFLESLVAEMGNAFRKSGFSYYERRLLEYESQENRKNVKYLRKHTSLSRSKNKMPRTKINLKKKKIVKFKFNFNKRKNIRIFKK